ncbi:chalcone isomerase family protein [Shewanella sp.]|uniref:chalcone isomerase family protein n=1 Tax=Shewanella sp. TaxID=50422 RepID=UPI00356380C3
MKTLNQTVNAGGNAYQWLVEVLFGVVGAVVVMLMLMLSMSNAMANQSSTIPSTDPQPVLAMPQPSSSSSLIQVGSANMSMMWFDIYSATLYSIDGKYQAEQWPLKLEIEYHRDIDAEDLIDATVDQWMHLGLSEQQIEQYREQLLRAWPDVKDGDRLTFMVNNRDQAEFLFNDKPYFQVSHAQFAVDFLAIWLSEHTSRPKLRQQLIGMN